MRGSEGIEGDKVVLEFSKLLIPKVTVQGSSPSLPGSNLLARRALVIDRANPRLVDRQVGLVARAFRR
jgi:hypothetical protein